MASEVPAARVALVTGGAQGLGRDIALRLADEGIDLALLDIPPKEQQLQDLVGEVKAKGRRAIYILADVTVEEQVKGAVERTAEELGSLDIVRTALCRCSLVTDGFDISR